MLRIGGYRLCWICCMQYFRISKLVNDGCMVKLSRGAPFHNAYFFGQRIYPKVQSIGGDYRIAVKQRQL
jgi:hypothetical protein